jgi:hypothetical protein
MPVPLAAIPERDTPGISPQRRAQPTGITVRGRDSDRVTAFQAIPNERNGARQELLLRPVEQPLVRPQLATLAGVDSA